MIRPRCTHLGESIGRADPLRNGCQPGTPLYVCALFGKCTVIRPGKVDGRVVAFCGQPCGEWEAKK